MVDQGWFDAEFVRDWTNGPFLVRDDDGTMLRSEIFAAGSGSGGFVAWDKKTGAPITYDIESRRYAKEPARLAISGEIVVDTREGPIRSRFRIIRGKVPSDVPGGRSRGLGSGAERDPGGSTATLASPTCCPLHLDRS